MDDDDDINVPPPPSPELLVIAEAGDDIRGKYAATITQKYSEVNRVGTDTFKCKQPFEILLRAKQPIIIKL